MTGRQRPSWLENLRSDWPAIPLSRRYSVQLGKMLNEQASQGPELFPYLRNVNVRWDSVDITDLSEMHFSAEERSRYRLAVGDLLVCEGGEIGRTTEWRGELAECFFQKAVHRLRPLTPGQVPRFLYYCMVAAAAEGAFLEDGNQSTIMHLTAEKLRAQLFPFPPTLVQAQTVEYLDRQTSRIDRLLAEKREVIKLLQERRVAAMTEGVRGTLVGVPLVRAGLPWLDLRGENWGEVKLTRVARLGSGHTPSRDHPEWWVDCTIPWITTGEVAQMRSDRIEFISETREMISEIGVANSAAQVHPAGTVVLCRTAASAGYSAIMSTPSATSQDFATWTCGPLLHPRFLLLCLRVMRRDLLGRLAMGSTHKTIYMPDIESLRIPLPTPEEQHQIVEAVWSCLHKIDRVTDLLEHQIDLLLEHRQALIGAAVTGQIDMSEVAA